MRTFRHLRGTAVALVLACAAYSSAAAQDSMGGFDQAYTNGGNLFGHGAWGTGDGTATPLPDPQIEYGFYFGRAYDGGNNLFGTGFWTAEYMVRRAETLSRHSNMDEGPQDGGPLGDGYAGDGAYGDDYAMDDGEAHTGDPVYYDENEDGHDKGNGGYEHKGKSGHDKKDHGDKKDHKKGKKPPKHEKPMPPKKHFKPKEKERVRYIPYARREVIVVPRHYSSVVVIERERTTELGRIEVTTRQRVETFGAVCLTGKGDEVEAILVTGQGGDEAYQGEIFRCPGDAMLRVSYATGSVEISGSVRMEDGSSYKDCDGGDALVRTGDGELVCAPKRRMSASAERSLARAGGAETQIISDGGYDDDGYGGGELDLSGLELTGGVGNNGGGY